MGSYERRIEAREIAHVLGSVMADGRGRTLFGGGPERALDALRRLTPAHSQPYAMLEIPLIGEPSYDAFVGMSSEALIPGDSLGDGSLTAAQAVVDWAAQWSGKRPLNLFFEFDAAGGGRQLSGIHCRHRFQLEAADAFYDVTGDGWRAPIYRSVVERLPKGWIAEFAAAFPGRPESFTRLELGLGIQARQCAENNPGYIRDCFETIGFSAYDDAMLEAIAGLVGLCPVNSLQFDIMADGTLGETFSLVSYFEGMGANFPALFGEGGKASEVLMAYQTMGVADDRWHQIAGALFARTELQMAQKRFCEITRLSIPCCAKAKWTSAELKMTKFYLIASATAS